MMQQTARNNMNQQRPFATTGDKFNTEYAIGKVAGSNFPYHEVRSLSRVNHICRFSVNQFCRFTSSAWPRCWAASVR